MVSEHLGIYNLVGKLCINQIITKISFELQLVRDTNEEVHGTMRTFKEGEDIDVGRDWFKKGRFEPKCEE